MAAARARSRFDREDVGPRSDVYTGLLAISLIAMVISCILLYLDYSQYGATKAPAVSVPPAVPKSGGQVGLVLPPPLPLPERPFTKADAPSTPVGLAEPQPAAVPPTVIAVAESPAPPSPAPVLPAVADQVPAPVVIPAVAPPVTLPAPAAEVKPTSAEGTMPLPAPVPVPAPPAVPTPAPEASAPAPVPVPPAAVAPPPAPQPAEPVATDPPPLPKSIKQLPPQ